MNGTPDGPWTYYDDAGVKMREQSMMNGDPHGACVVYDYKGRVIQRMHYEQGRLHGTMSFYDSDGRVTKSVEYKYGSRVQDAPPALKGNERAPASVPGMDRKR